MGKPILVYAILYLLKIKQHFIKYNLKKQQKINLKKGRFTKEKCFFMAFYLNKKASQKTERLYS